jgi:hypothetical protein
MDLVKIINSFIIDYLAPITARANNKLEKQVNVLMRNHYNLILWQAYKNLEYYIIQTATGYDNNKMEIINTNLNCFITDENNKDYKDTVMILMEKFEIKWPPVGIRNLG